MPKFSEEELARLLELASSIEGPTNENAMLSDVEKYVMERGIKSGEGRIFNHQVYDDYFIWSENPMKPRNFAIQFCKLFRRMKATHNGWVYPLDPEPFRLDKDKEYTRMRILLRNIRVKKEEQKKLGKVSRPNPKRKCKTKMGTYRS